MLCYGTDFIYHADTAGFLLLQLYSGGEQPTPQEEDLVFTASVSRVEKITPPSL